MYEWIKGHKFMSVVIVGLMIAVIVEICLIAQFMTVLCGS